MSKVDWLTFDQALTESRKQDKLIFLDFSLAPR